MSASEVLFRPREFIKEPHHDDMRESDAISLPDRFKGDTDADPVSTSQSGGAALAFAQHSLFGVLAAAQPAGHQGSDATTTLPDVGMASDGDSSDDEDDSVTRELSNAIPDLRLSEITLPRENDCDSPPAEGHESTIVEGADACHRIQNTTSDRCSPILSHKQKNIASPDALKPPVKLLAESASVSTLRPVDADDHAPSEPHPPTLPGDLGDIFHIDQSESLLAQQPCWYLQNALLQGFMYITQRHICFYAYLEPTGDDTLKSGHLSKRGKTNPHYRRYYFTLKGTVLSYFASNAALYYPSGNIDLRNAVSVNLARDQDGHYFSIITDRRTYYFKADSENAASDWVRSIRATMDRSRTDANSIKIALPIDNILDVEDCPIIDAGDTIRIRVVDNDETFAVDEYFFTFFGISGQEILDLLTRLTQDSSAYKALISPNQAVADDATCDMLPATDNSSPSSIDHLIFAPSTSRSASQHLDGSTVKQSAIAHSTSPDHCARSDDTDESLVFSQNEDPSASIILSGDGVFRASTLSQANVQQPPIADTAQPISGGLLRSTSPNEMSQRSRLDTRPTLDNATKSSTMYSAGFRPSPHRSMSYTESLGGLVRAGTTQMRRANDLAYMLKFQSKRVSTLVGQSSRGYYEKVYGMWAGGKKHYASAEGLLAEDHVIDAEEEADAQQAEARFREYFALPDTERLVASFFGHILRVLPLYGKLYVGTTRLCFRSLLPGTRTKLVLPFKDIMTVEKEKGFRFGYSGLVVVVRGHEEIFFEFANAGLRDDCTVTVLRSLDVSQSGVAISDDDYDDHKPLLEDTSQRPPSGPDQQLHGVPLDLHAPTFFDDPDASVLEFKPDGPLNITCLTIGSRGDVQPYIALCKGLLAEGHKPTIATHKEFEPWVRKHGIAFARVDGDPAELMQICVENGMFTPSFLYEANSKFRGFLETLLETAWSACQGADVLIESPSAMAGIHIAEALGIPYFRAFTMPWTRTRAYPHAFAVPNHKMGGAYNYMTYVFFDNIFWQSTAGQINRWRRKVLGLPSTSLDKLQPNKVPFLYNFSPSVVMPPLDFSDWIRVTGYWFLDEGSIWTPPPALIEFIARARSDKVPLVYIGFGSIVVSDSKAMTASIVAAVQKADVRCILSKGWSDRLSKISATDADSPTLPDSIYPINSAPHDWLFSQIDCAVHHGGAGTTGASLRAGVPTLITPFFGDQFFFANRVQDLGVGMYVQSNSEQQLGKALWIGTHDGRMRAKAKTLGEAIRRENGVGQAIKALWRDMEYATSLIKNRGPAAAASQDPADAARTAAGSAADGGAIAGDSEQPEQAVDESWTLIESDTDLTASTTATSTSTSRQSLDRSLERGSEDGREQHSVDD